ncbi:hypothetical protein PR003_g6164 [Phytophthora rubi]|uniref:Tc1-like transposase DDE domain-containing protein n=1 Tax=Phytophthora rubi TaxID=129364 RepID=A0A6A4FN84_9STRA|nr:hypothetical protein PR003_g6164 [Phytophthora rubi]
MFLAAVARPRYDANIQVLFDGKIGIWDFTKQAEAQRTSKNRPAGTLETKNLDSVNGKVYKRYLLEHVIAAIKAKWPICEKLEFQPANSPDYNTLDLGYFSSIQALQYQEDCYNIDQLIRAVRKSYDALECEKLDNIFLTLQKVFECALRAGGSNEYKLPHIGKDKLRRLGKLPQSLPCDLEAFRYAVAILHEGVVINV